MKTKHVGDEYSKSAQEFFIKPGSFNSIKNIKKTVIGY